MTRRSIAAALLLAALATLSSATLVSGIILREEQKAPTLVGSQTWGSSVSYDFNDRNGRLVVIHWCVEVYELRADGGIVHGPVLQQALLAPGQSITLDAWPATSWGMCIAQLWEPDAKGHPGIGHSDLQYLVEP